MERKNSKYTYVLFHFEFSCSGFPRSQDKRAGFSKNFCRFYPIFILHIPWYLIQSRKWTNVLHFITQNCTIFSHFSSPLWCDNPLFFLCPLLYTVPAQIEQRCSNKSKGFFAAVAFKFGRSAVIIKMLFCFSTYFTFSYI